MAVVGVYHATPPGQKGFIPSLVAKNGLEKGFIPPKKHLTSHATFLPGITHDTVSPENTPSGIKNDTTSELNSLKSLAFVSRLHRLLLYATTKAILLNLMLTYAKNTYAKNLQLLALALALALAAKFPMRPLHF